MLKELITDVEGIEVVGTMKEIINSKEYAICIDEEISFSIVDYDPHKLTLDEMREWDLAFSLMGY